MDGDSHMESPTVFLTVDVTLPFRSFFKELIYINHSINKTDQQCSIDEDDQIGCKNHHDEIERVVQFVSSSKQTDTVK